MTIDVLRRLTLCLGLGVLLALPVAAQASDPGVKTYNLQTFYYLFSDGKGGWEGTMSLSVGSDGAVKGIYRGDYGRGPMQTVTGILDGHNRIVMDIGNGLQPSWHLTGTFDPVSSVLRVSRQIGFTTWVMTGKPQLPNGQYHPVHYDNS